MNGPLSMVEIVTGLYSSMRAMLEVIVTGFAVARGIGQETSTFKAPDPNQKEIQGKSNKFSHGRQYTAKGKYMKKIAVLMLAALPVFAVAQKPDEVKQLKQENAILRIQITGLQNALIQAQAQEASKNVSEAHAKAVTELEALTGKKWDEQQGKLVDKVNAAK